MGTFGGNIVGESAVSGQYDESGAIGRYNTLVAKIDGYQPAVTNITDIKTVVTSADYGVQATWSVVDGLRLGFNGFLGYSATDTQVSWKDTAQKVELANQQSAQALVDLTTVINKLNQFNARFDAIETKLNSCLGSLGTLVTMGINLSQSLSELETKLKRWLHGLLSAVQAFIQTAVSPIFGLCHTDSNASCCDVAVGSDFGVSINVTRPIDGVSNIGSSYDSVGMTHTFSSRYCDKYGLFLTETGELKMYYSDELKQVISRPYRNSGRVYLS